MDLKKNMKNFIISEEERKRIRLLYERAENQPQQPTTQQPTTQQPTTQQPTTQQPTTQQPTTSTQEPTTQPTPQQPVINTNHDRAYDYKFENGKYFYSKKGQNKWIEATGKGLEAIKTNVFKTTQQPNQNLTFANATNAISNAGATMQGIINKTSQPR